MERLDKVLAAQGKFSRTDVKKLVKAGAVKVNGIIASAADIKIDYDKDFIEIHGKAVDLRKYVYIMLNKPQGIVSSTEKGTQTTVIDLVPENMRRNGLFPAGRLDKDTSGFILITDNGDFAHRILSPKNHIEKTYEVQIEKELTHDEMEEMRSGLSLNGDILLPAKIRLLEKASFGLYTIDNTTQSYPIYEIKICEGKYHQIKRMFARFKKPVINLHRSMMGELPLDPLLKVGECRYISDIELSIMLN